VSINFRPKKARTKPETKMIRITISICGTISGQDSPKVYPMAPKKRAQTRQLINWSDRNLVILIPRMPKARALARRIPKIY